MKKILIFILVFNSLNLLAQIQRVKEKKVYIGNDNKVRLVANDKLFTGVVEKVKNHNFTEYEEKFEEGVLMELNVYFRNSNKISDKYVYDSEKPLNILKRIRYGHHDGWMKVIHLDENEQTELIEVFQDEQLIHSCEYSGRFKNGREIFYAEGNRREVFYIYGEEVKIESISSKG